MNALKFDDILDTNKILKFALSTMGKTKSKDKWEKQNCQDKKNDFIKLIKVNVETVKPILFTGMKYHKDLHEKNTFLFLDKQFKLMGMLIGNEHKKEWDTYEYYICDRWASHYENYLKWKNRKNLTDVATYVLMITPEMQIYNPKQIYNYKKRRNTADIAKRELQSRLAIYKTNKYKKSDDNDIKAKITEVMVYLTANLFSNDKGLLEKGQKAGGFTCSDIWDVIERFSRAAHDYEYYWNQYVKFVNSDTYKEKDWYKEGCEDSFRKVTPYKLNIIDWYNTILNK